MRSRFDRWTLPTCSPHLVSHPINDRKLKPMTKKPMTKTQYSIATPRGTKKTLAGYFFDHKGIAFGVDHRNKKEWIITEIECGRTIGAKPGKTRSQAVKHLAQHFERLAILHTDPIKRIRDAVKTCGPVDDLPED